MKLVTMCDSKSHDASLGSSSLPSGTMILNRQESTMTRVIL